jgi:hypothetical protein
LGTTPESDSRLFQSEESSGKSEEWMLTGKSIAITGHHRVFEDGPELSPTGSPEGSIDHGGDYSDSEMYTNDMLDEEGKPVLARANMSAEQANPLREQETKTEPPKQGVKMSEPTMFD